MTLDQPIEATLRLTARQISALRKLGLTTLRDLLFHFPVRYEVLSGLRAIRDLREGEKATVIAEVVKLKAEKTWKKKMRIAEGIVKDGSGLLQVVWFNQPYVANILKPGTRAQFSGKVSRNKLGALMTNPLYETLAEGAAAPSAMPTILPVYPESYGITSRWFRYHIQRLLGSVALLPEAIPREILEKYHLPAADRAIRAIHVPKNLGEAEASRKRFSFEEIFLIQLNRQRLRKKLEQERAFRIESYQPLLERFAHALPFSLTAAQKKAVAQILEDFEKPHPMARLLEGDVGSGKTLVAAATALNVVASGFQAAYMAPTEILAHQHFDEFIRRLAPFKIRIGLLTGSEARKFPSKVNPRNSTRVSKNQLLRWCLNGEIQVLIGTHALIEDRVKFKKLAFVIVDEQHRFGVEQRRAATKGIRPHFLSMSATPIPRTLALTIYGDLDLTVLDEMPPGRQPVETHVVAPRERERTYGFIREDVRRGGQVFVICPRIEDPKARLEDRTSDTYLRTPASQAKLEWSEVKSVKAEFKKLSEEIFPDLHIGIVHGKLKPKEKEAVMKKFKNRELDILVSTSVVEVGVDVPNASIMMIEGGERFGLAQLHQFRGRVGRGSRKSHCFVFTTSGDYANSRRLKALQEVKTGFELAEYDLQFRGPGELSGRKQWGISDVGMEALKNIKMVEAARAEAKALIATDPELKNYPSLREQIAKLETSMHFE
ncbi:MAG: ATP-dependent DNA helicase RecG [Candidatus Sungbacteria bacterium]|uniref:Probable DNA 3'-5' helicase RecG n=1 Tax=Candidatus Sungiibacteriota bacterium TaxID=2750080 RepID=A0A932YWQ6_9BACT|nr:ATP-dependent DNA helicase RecG [Candidatus Sungbacteria bacterium]